MDPLVVAALALAAVTATPYFAFAALYLLVRPSGSPADKRADEPTVSVVLPTYNEERIIERKLKDILGQDYPMRRMELVVVDASDDETVDLVEGVFEDREHPTLVVIREEERRGLAVALNDAYDVASGEVVVKTDCDSRLAEDAVREAVANLADPRIGGVTGRNARVLGGSAVEAGYRSLQARIQILESHLDSTLIFHGPFSAFKAEEIVSIDPDSIADDSELALKIRKRGKRVVFDPAIRYEEAAHSDIRKRRRQKDRRAMGLLRLLWRHRDVLGRDGKYGKVVLPFNWWFMFLSPWLLSLAGVMSVVAAWSMAGIAGIAAILFPLGSLLWLGSREALGLLQPVYAIFDTQISLFLASLHLVRGYGDGTWEIDEELREIYN